MPVHSTTTPPMSPPLMQKSRSNDSTVAVQSLDESLKSPTSVMAFGASSESPSRQQQRSLFAESPRGNATPRSTSSGSTYSHRYAYETDDEEDDLCLTIHSQARPASIFLPRGPSTMQDSNLAQMLTIRRSNAFEED